MNNLFVAIFCLCYLGAILPVSLSTESKGDHVPREEKPKTKPVANTESCGEANPADIEFFFSHSDLGLDATSWTTNFITNVIDAKEMDKGFRYGVNSGSSKQDRGFNLDAYDKTDDILEHLLSYHDKVILPSLINMDVFDASRGGRLNARDVAVIFVGYRKSALGLAKKVKELTDNDVQVFVANPVGNPINIPGAIALSGRLPREQSRSFINMLCPEE